MNFSVRRAFVFLTAALMISIVAFTTGSLSASDNSAEKDYEEFVHVVFFWLNEDASETQKRQLIDDCQNLLGSIESVTRIEVGVPAGTPREVVDNSYGVGIVIYYDDKEGHDLYQIHEKHDEFIERNHEIWERVQVYDLLTEK